MAMTGATTSTLRVAGRTRGRQHAAVSRPAGGSRPGGPGGPQRPVPPEVYRRRRLVVVGVLLVALVLGLIAVRNARGGSPDDPIRPAAAGANIDDAADAAVDDLTGADDAEAVDTGDEAADEPVVEELEACMLEVPEVKSGDTGADVECAQRALRAAGFYDGEIDGEFDQAVVNAARSFQHEYGLYVDGIVGRNTATELGVWPGADSFIVRTPPPAPGATDLWGMALSSVASAGDDAPELPSDAGQGTGKRVVYERASQRVWAIDGDERIVRSYLVSGSQYRNEVPGVHTVYSKSDMALGWDLQADLPLMIRYIQTERGHIGFHAIPKWKETGEYLQTEDELGEKLSGGCQRQALLDAQFLWAFADVGTKVWVL